MLIISTDPAHNLSDAFRQKFSADPTLVNGFTNLFAMVSRLNSSVPGAPPARAMPAFLDLTCGPQEVDPNPKQSGLSALNENGGGMLTEIAGAIPGIDEAMSFAEVLKQVSEPPDAPWALLRHQFPFSCRPAAPRN